MKTGGGKQGAGNKNSCLTLDIGHWTLDIGHWSLLLFPLLLLWRPLFAGESFFWGTPLLQFVPWQRMAAEMWRAGSLPLWNPLAGCGTPLAANYQTAAFYPLNALYLLMPAEMALSWTSALHLALAGWGMYRWARAVGLDEFPALIGALSLSGSGFLVARVTLFPSIAFTFPWLAVWLWRAEVLIQNRRPFDCAQGRLRDALWLGLSLGLGLLAGHAQTAFYGGVLLAAYFVFRTLQEERSRKQEAGGYVSRLTFLLALSLALGVGLAAVQLIPTAELMLSSQRSSGVNYDSAMTYSLWPWRLITFAAPDFFGNPGVGNYQGYAAYWEDAGYVGLLPLLLAVEAILSRKQRSGGGDQVGFWVVGASVALVLALGKNTPVFPFLFHHIPTFDMFRSPARWLAVTTVSLAALAALGAQRWPRGHRGRRRGALGVAVGIAMLIGGLAAQRLVSGAPSTFGLATARFGVTLVVAGTLALLRRDTFGWRAAVAAFVALDLLLFGWPLAPAVDRSLYRGETEAAAFLRGEPGPVRVYWPVDPLKPNSDYGAEYRVKFSYLKFDDFGPRDVNHWREMREALLPNAGMLDGVSSANNFEPLLVGRYADLLEAAVEAPTLLRIMGVTHVASDRTWPEGKIIHASGPAMLYRLPDALGRAWIVPEARYIPSDEMLTALTDPAFDPTAEVLLETPPIPRPNPQSPIPNPQSLTLQDTPNRVTIRAVLDAPGYLVLADTYYPGWRATVDGEPVDILRANYSFRAVWLEAGEHVVEMTYRPASVLVGGTVSLAALLLLVVGLLLARRAKP